MNPSNNLTAFYNLAATLNDRLNQLNKRLECYEETAPSVLNPSISTNPLVLSIDGMSGEQFENWCCQLLREKGYADVKTTQTSSDYGADIIAEKEGIRFAIQCKRHSEPVGIKAVQEAHGAKKHYNCDIAVVMTSSSFTNAARELANECRVKLWDRVVIESWLESV